MVYGFFYDKISRFEPGLIQRILGSKVQCLFVTSIIEALHVDEFCDRCRRTLPASTSFSYAGRNVGFDRFCLDCERHSGPMLLFFIPTIRLGVFESFESSLIHVSNFRGLSLNNLSVQRLHHMAIHFRDGTSQPQHLLDQLDLVVSEIAVALLYAVWKVCQYYFSQPEFASVEAPMKLRCGGMQIFGIFYCFHVKIS